MRAAQLGQIVTPATRNRVLGGVAWIADNAVFADKYPGDDAYLIWLQRQPDLRGCRFAVAPDVVGDHAATLERSVPMLPRIRALGLPVAFVGQDGATPDALPWVDFDALFIGGSDDWKLGEAARSVVSAARGHGKWVHMGRVNSQRRLQYAADIGCHSADGTYIAFGPDVNLPKALGWVQAVNGRTLATPDPPK